jgi:hypothetical protein
MIAIQPVRGATLPARQDLERVIKWCDTDPPFDWMEGVAGVAMAVHPVVPIGTPSPGARAFWTGDVAIRGSGSGISELPDEPVRLQGTLTGLRNPARQPQLTIRADVDRIVAKLSGGRIPPAWGADFDVVHIRDEDGLVRADWTLRPGEEGGPAEASEFALLFELLMWPALAKNVDLGPP